MTRTSGLISLIKSGKISSSKASQDLFPLMLKYQELSPLQLADEHQLIQESDTDAILDFVKQAIAKYPEKALAYKEGKKNLLGLFMGEVMKLSKGKADPKSTNKLVREELEK